MLCRACQERAFQAGPVGYPTDRSTPAGPAATVARMIRRLLPATLALGLALTGCGSDDTTPQAAPTTSAPRNEVECVNIDRAYNAWDSPSRPKTADDFAAANLGTFNMAKEYGDDFAKAVTGYDDQPSKVLASTVAAYNFEMALANAQITISGKVEDDQAKKLEEAAAKVESDYRAWKTATC